ncbi:hypothetical protein L207DRAFT_584854 [Hyaloscypha variabilis F]|uniref:Uncharacterized protein n=1 Tax=Hyaloscypha variabilis (strain UAMH 11265 / GT02V1 / F) TaxID=1149755 RepID=A0A2J6RHF1_HYAVF|nr:hypothetical protein L207DRAFT_584854 [Hyaloscypha variabilis F]
MSSIHTPPSIITPILLLATMTRKRSFAEAFEWMSGIPVEISRPALHDRPAKKQRTLRPFDNEKENHKDPISLLDKACQKNKIMIIYEGIETRNGRSCGWMVRVTLCGTSMTFYCDKDYPKQTEAKMSAASRALAWMKASQENGFGLSRYVDKVKSANGWHHEKSELSNDWTGMVPTAYFGREENAISKIKDFKPDFKPADFVWSSRLRDDYVLPEPEPLSDEDLERAIELGKEGDWFAIISLPRGSTLAEQLASDLSKRLLAVIDEHNSKVFFDELFDGAVESLCKRQDIGMPRYKANEWMLRVKLSDDDMDMMDWFAQGAAQGLQYARTGQIRTFANTIGQELVKNMEDVELRTISIFFLRSVVGTGIITDTGDHIMRQEWVDAGPTAEQLKSSFGPVGRKKINTHIGNLSALSPLPRPFNMANWKKQAFNEIYMPKVKNDDDWSVLGSGKGQKSERVRAAKRKAGGGRQWPKEVQSIGRQSN